MPFSALEEGCKDPQDGGRFPFAGSHAANRCGRKGEVLQGEGLWFPSSFFLISADVTSSILLPGRRSFPWITV